MRLRVISSARWWLGGLAAGGVVASHWLAYSLAVPDPHLRHEVLAETGHGYWQYAVAVVLGLVVASLSGFACQRVWPSRADSGDRGSPYYGVAGRLIALQATGLLILEGAERALTGTEPLGVFTEAPVIIGLAVQVLVALAAALLLVLFARAVDFVHRLVSRTCHRERPAPVQFPINLSVLPPRLRVATGGGTLRGPPR
jgi:hypothetical protein